MSEQAGTQGGEEEPVFSLERVYVKDLSFESPQAPEIFTQQGQPQVSVELGTEGRVISEHGHVEAVLTVTVRSSLGEQTIFIAEVQQAGLFRVAGIPDEQLEQLMGINCPTILFPYARETIASMVGRGGFQQLLLDPVNFQALYERSRQHKADSEEH